MPASCSVANNAMEAPTGPEGVRPCDSACAGMANSNNKATKNNHRPARCMARLYRSPAERTSFRS